MPDLADLLTWNALASFVTLTFLEIVLSVDNILFVAIAAARLPPERQNLGRQLGLWLALLFRVGMLAGLVWLTRLDVVLVHVFGRDVTIKDAVLLCGGLFLIYKGSTEIHDDIAAAGKTDDAKPVKHASLVAVIAQIGFINIIFSLDSVITAVGMANQLPVMISAVVVATVLMMVAAKPVGDFIDKRPAAKTLGLAFIILVGVALVGDGTGFHVPRGYLYFAIAFSLFVELLNSARRKKAK